MTVYLQHSKPPQAQESNWLPAPAGAFNLTMRYYTPLAPVLNRPTNFPPSARPDPRASRIPRTSNTASPPVRWEQPH